MHVKVRLCGVVGALQLCIRFGACRDYHSKGTSLELSDTVDGRNPAPPKKPWNADSPVNTNQPCFPWIPSGAGFRPSTVAQLQSTIPPCPNVFWGCSGDWFEGHVSGLHVLCFFGTAEFQLSCVALCLPQTDLCFCFRLLYTCVWGFALGLWGCCLQALSVGLHGCFVVCFRLLECLGIGPQPLPRQA